MLSPPPPPLVVGGGGEDTQVFYMYLRPEGARFFFTAGLHEGAGQHESAGVIKIAPAFQGGGGHLIRGGRSPCSPPPLRTPLDPDPNFYFYTDSEPSFLYKIFLNS